MAIKAGQKCQLLLTVGSDGTKEKVIIAITHTQCKPELFGS